MTQPFVGTHTEAEWREWATENVSVTEEGAFVGTDPLPAYVSPRAVIDERDAGVSFVDVALDDCGDRYLLSADGAVYRIDRGRDRLSELACTWENGIERPVGLAVTDDTIYVAQAASGDDGDDGEENGGGGSVQAVAKQLLHHRWTRSEGLDDPVEIRSEGRHVAVLDGGTDERAGRLLRLSRSASLETEIEGLSAPIDFAFDRERSRYVLEQVDADGDGNGGGDGDDDRRFRIRRFAAPDRSSGEPCITGPVCDDPDSDDSADDGSDDDSDGNSDGSSNGDDAVLVPPGGFRVQETAESFEPFAIEADRDGEVLVGVGPGAARERTLFRRDPEDGGFHRLEGFETRVSQLLLERERQTGQPVRLYVLSGDGAQLTELDASVAHSLNPRTGRYEGVLVARFDSGIEHCQWDRLRLDRGEGDGTTRITVEYAASDDPDEQLEEEIGVEAVDGIGPVYAERLRDAGVATLDELVRLDPAVIAEYAGTASRRLSQTVTADWIDEARDLLRASGDVEWQRLSVTNPSEALLSEAVGRYLWVRLELVGGRFTSPSVESFRAYFPRQSYLRYLPSIYRADEASEAFLARFLSIFESVFVDLEEQIESSVSYLDPEGIPAEHVPWLEDWLALEVDETWPTEKRRTLLQHAPELFRYRGTRPGVLATLRLLLQGRSEPPAHWTWALDREREAIDGALEAGTMSEADAAAAKRRRDRRLFVAEHSELSCIDDDAVRSIYEQLFPCPQCFAVLLPPQLDDGTMDTADRVVRSQQPAHSVGRAIQLEPEITLAGDEYDRAHHSYLGVNTALRERSYVLEEATLGEDAVLREHERDGQLGLRSRLGTDTRIS